MLYAIKTSILIKKTVTINKKINIVVDKTMNINKKQQIIDKKKSNNKTVKAVKANKIPENRMQE